jgi:membrane associated rhomboid family serine protease
MKRLWRRFLEALMPGTRTLLVLLVVVYGAAVAGSVTHSFNLAGWLTLSGPQFWSGQIWRLASYALLPAGILDFIMNSIALVCLGGMLERHWSRGEFWLYCLVAAAGAGLAKVLLQWSSPLPLIGMAPTIFGLLIAWGFLCGRQNVAIVPFGEITVWKLVLTAGAIGLLIMFLTAGLVTAMIMAAAGLSGWLYLWLKHKWLMLRPGSVVESNRISRLEL